MGSPTLGVRAGSSCRDPRPGGESLWHEKPAAKWVRKREMNRLFWNLIESAKQRTKEVKSKWPFLHFYNLAGFMVKVNLITWDKSLTQHCPEVMQEPEQGERGWGGHMGGGCCQDPQELGVGSWSQAALLLSPLLAFLQGFIATGPPKCLKLHETFFSPTIFWSWGGVWRIKRLISHVIPNHIPCGISSSRSCPASAPSPRAGGWE